MKSLQAIDVSSAIGEVLDGRWTQSQLGDWAHLMLLESTSGTRDIERGTHDLIVKSLHRLMALAEGTEFATFEMTPAELEDMRNRLSSANEIPDSS